MADLAQLESALVKADAAGDVDGARLLAAEVRKMRSAPTEGTQTAGWKPFTPSGSRAGGIANVTGAEAIMGNPVTQFAIGAAEPVLGAAQALGAPIDAKAIKEMSDRGAQLYGGNWTKVPARLAGNILSPVFLGLAKAMPAATTLGELVKAGTAMGIVAGATTLQEDNNLGQRAVNTGIGAVTGAALPLAIAGTKAVGRGVGNLTDLFRGENGASNILDRYLQRTIGPQNVPVVAQQMRAGAGEPLPGYKPTAAEAVAGLPEGSPIIAHQRITAATPGGPSALFGRRIESQKAAIQAAGEARDTQLVPLLNKSLEQANKTGIKADDVVAKIDDMLAKPGFRASDVVNKSLNAVKEKISSLSANGTTDGQDLWTVRKEIGNTIKTFSKETANWDKRLTSGLERQIQKSIDEAIVKAGGTDWPSQMAQYAKQSQAIQAVKETAKTAMKPTQRTDLFGGLRIAEETRTHVPQLLSRPMMAANAILRYFSASIEPAIDKVAAQRYLNPQEFAAALDKLPPQAQSKIMQAMERVGVAAAVTQEIKANEPSAAAREVIPQPQSSPSQTLRGINGGPPPRKPVPYIQPPSFVRG